jgi:hypothetical protein
MERKPDVKAVSRATVLRFGTDGMADSLQTPLPKAGR